MESDDDATIVDRVEVVTDANLALASALVGNRRGRVGTTKRDYLVNVVSEYMTGRRN